ncbi:MAG: DNA polymerase IV [Methyloceanibacter sp.]|jgi:DNA polymerase-4
MATKHEHSWPRTIAHADMDAFYAAVEQLDDPSLRGKPILVGPRSHRGVVLTASYEARPYRVGSAMPMAKARRLCPDAVIVPPRFDRYQDVSRTVMSVFATFSPDVEALSLDEAFLDMTGAEQLFGDPEAMGRRLKDAVCDATGGLTVSVGLSSTKYVAKVASSYLKPDGLTIVPPEQAKAWLAPLPVSRLWGAGPKTQERLHDLGLQTIADVADADPKFLLKKLGKPGLLFHSLAHAKDPRAVTGHRGGKSIGSEHTLDTDISDVEEIKRHLRRSAENIGRRLRRKGTQAFGVSVKLKTADFQLLSRQRRLNEATDVTETIYSVGVELLKAFDPRGPFRLIGMAAYDLVSTEDKTQLDLFGGSARQRQLDAAIDDLSERYGANIVHRGNDLTTPSLARLAATLDFLDDDPDD